MPEPAAGTFFLCACACVRVSILGRNEIAGAKLVLLKRDTTTATFLRVPAWGILVNLGAKRLEK